MGLLELAKSALYSTTFLSSTFCREIAGVVKLHECSVVMPFILSWWHIGKDMVVAFEEAY
jgi:hypothetical protein